MIENLKFYLLCFSLAFVLSLFFVPIIRKVSLFFENYDVPTDIKTHKGKVPLSGGLAIFISFSIVLIFMRFYTSFPTGTLRDLRYILIGGFIILMLGLIDDLKKPEGLPVWLKFLIQFVVAGFMVFFGFKIKFIYPEYISIILSILWIVGVSNALNIIDIMDGLSSSQVFISSIAFLFIALPYESIYVNFLASSLAGASLGFIPYNMSKRYKIFMGDSGSLFCGFILAVLSLGTEYSRLNPLAVYAPLFILAIPIYDTLFVSFMRLRKGISPFKGSKDHYALRLEKIGFSRNQIVFLSFIASLILSFSAFLVTRLSLFWGILIYFIVGGEFIILSFLISKIKI